MEGTQRCDLVNELVNLVAELGSFGGGNPFQPQSLGLYPKLGKRFLEQHHTASRLIVTRAVMAISGMTASYHHPIGSLGKGVEDKGRLHPARAHGSNDPEIGG